MKTVDNKNSKWNFITNYCPSLSFTCFLSPILVAMSSIYWHVFVYVQIRQLHLNHRIVHGIGKRHPQVDSISLQNFFQVVLPFSDIFLSFVFDNYLNFQFHSYLTYTFIHSHTHTRTYIRITQPYTQIHRQIDIIYIIIQLKFLWRRTETERKNM